MQATHLKVQNMNDIVTIQRNFFTAHPYSFKKRLEPNPVIKQFKSSP